MGAKHPTPDRLSRWLFGTAGLVLAGLFAYGPALRGGWLWDDDLEIFNNPDVLRPDGWWRNWVHPAGADYFPLKTTVEWVEWRLWGDHVLGYHLVNLGFHLLGAILLWKVLEKLGVRLAYLGACLFAVHPVCVESVAWISEIKNTMSLPLMLSGLWAWMIWEEGGAGRAWFAALILFVAAMLCKSSVVMFPAVLLLHAWWRRGRVGWGDWRAALPLFAVSLVLGGVTVWFQAHRAILDLRLDLGGPLHRLAAAGPSLSFYLGKSVLPLRTIPIYPDWGATLAESAGLASAAVIAAVLACLWRMRSGFGRSALLGLGFFFLNLLPVVGFVPMAYLRISRVADHFSYISLLGTAGLATAGIGALPGRIRGAGVALAAVLCAAFLLISREQAGHYRSPEKYWAFIAERNPNAWLAENNLGAIAGSKGRLAEAIGHFQSALASAPDYAEAESGLGFALFQDGRPEEALAHLDRAVRLRPGLVAARIDRGLVETYANDREAALADYEAAVRLDPFSAEAEEGLGFALAYYGRSQEAIPHFRSAIRLRPGFREAHFNLGNAFLRLGRPAEAIAEYEATLRIDPAYAPAARYLELARRRAGDQP